MIRKLLALGVMLGAFVALAFTAARAADNAQVTIDTGGLRGSAANGVVSFKGIPFAQAPVGDLRWQPPQLPKRWSGTRDATAYGPDCMQEPFPGDAAPLGVKPEEDCLYVNVWTPERRGSGKLPVMVWIYGGGFVNGGSSPAVYDGSAFARDGVVLVSFNYRLGHFGFFAHPALSAEQKGRFLGNYALMDQIAALEWVQRNVAAFGGDPQNVTIFGESAGGIAVHILMTSPLTAGLFQKAIVESGAGRPGLFGERKISGGPDSAEARGLLFAKKHGIEGEDAAALKKLRAIPAADIAKGFNMMTMGDPTYAGGPVLDGKIVVGAPSTLYAKGQSEGNSARVPLILGATDMDIGGDQLMAEPVRHIARIRSAHGLKVWQFRFSYVAESMRKEWPGAMHATEIPYVFDTVAARYGKDLTAADSAAAKAAHAYWVGFAKTGAPSAPGLPEWAAYDSKSDVIMDFTLTGPKAGPDAWRARLDVAEAASDARERSAGTH